MEHEELKVVLCGVGRNLASLALRSVSEEAIGVVVEQCPNLQYLEVKFLQRFDSEKGDLIKQTFKVWLNKLAKLKVNGVSVRLGTVWAGVVSK